MQEIIAQYTALWTAHYSKSEFGGTSVEAAAAYATMDCLNVGKSGNWTEADYLEDIQYWKSKTEKATAA